MSKGGQPLPFGHSADAAVDIEGLMVMWMSFTTKNMSEPLDSFWKITCRNFAKKRGAVPIMTGRMMKRPLGKAGMSKPIPIRNLSLKDG